MLTPFSSGRSTRPKRTLQHRRPAVERLEPRNLLAAFDVLVFSRTAEFRHDSIDEGIAAIEALGAGHECPHR